MLTLCHNYFRVTPNNKNNKDAVQRFNKRKFAFGVFILLLVVVLWVVSSEVTKYLYIEKHIERPFLITYVRSSLLFIYLIVLCFTPPTRDPCQPADYTQLLEPTAETDDENYFNESNNSLGDSTFVPVRAGETTDSDDAAPRAVRFNKVAEVRVMSAAMASEALLARLSWAASVRATEHAQRRAAAAATRRHLRLAMLFCVPVKSKPLSREETKSLVDLIESSKIITCKATNATSNKMKEEEWIRIAEKFNATATSCPRTSQQLRLKWENLKKNSRKRCTKIRMNNIKWFISNYLYRLSILHTTSGSATIYTSTAGAFALSLGAIFAQVPNDRFTLSKCIAVLLTAAGLVVLGISESHQTSWVAVLSALGSALCYAIHLLIFRHALRSGDDINSPLLVGLVGCACGCLTWVVGGILAAGDVERADLPPPRQWLWLLLDAALGPLLIESLWLWGRSLTSTQAATGMLGLAVPLSLCAEAWRGGVGGGVWKVLAGALAGAGWAAAAAHLPRDLALSCLAHRLRAAEGFTVIRNIPDLDEQSEALMSSDEPT